MESSISRNREQGCAGGGAGSDDDDSTPMIKRPSTPAEEDDIMSSWLLMEDYNEGSTVDELMKFLDDDTSAAAKVKFIDNPYSSPLIFQSSSSYITINGNEETCGSSFSDWESSVMASVHMGGFANAGKVDCMDGFEFCDWFQGGNGGAWVLNGAESAARGEKSGGGDGVGWDFGYYYECFVCGEGDSGWWWK